MLRKNLLGCCVGLLVAGCATPTVEPEPSFEFSEDDNSAVVRSETGDQYALTVEDDGQLTLSAAGAEFKFPSSENLTFSISTDAADELSLSVVDDEIAVTLADENGMPTTVQFADPGGQVRSFIEALVQPEAEFEAALSRSDCMRLDATIEVTCERLADYSPEIIKVLVEYLLTELQPELANYLPMANRILDNYYPLLPEFCDTYLDLESPCDTKLPDLVD